MFLDRLRAREDDGFLELFTEHADQVAEGGRAFLRFVQHYDDPAQRREHAAAVAKAERSADRIAAEVVRQVHKSSAAPLGRDTARLLVDAMDDILDELQGSAELMGLYDVQAVDDEVLRLADLSLRCCERVQHVVTLLPRLREPEVAESALKMCEEIDRLESDADRVMREAVSRLFREEPDVRELIKLKAVYEHLESVSDRCEDVARIVEGVVLGTG